MLLGAFASTSVLSVLAIAAGPILSIPVAWVTSKHTINVEKEKTRLAAEERALEILIQARLKVYPELYSLLSDMTKAFDIFPTVKIDIRDMLAQFNRWDSQNAILMTLETSNTCNTFRKALVGAVSKGRVPGVEDDLADLQELGTKLKLALRTDLVIHGVGKALKLEQRENW